jgi:hypothetical protein
MLLKPVFGIPLITYDDDNVEDIVDYEGYKTLKSRNNKEGQFFQGVVSRSNSSSKRMQERSNQTIASNQYTLVMGKGKVSGGGRTQTSSPWQKIAKVILGSGAAAYR